MRATTILAIVAIVAAWDKS